MSKQSNSRKLAIVSIDLFGYTRLMEQDEVGTHRSMMACRRHLLEPVVRSNDGEIVKSTGDGALITFPAAKAAAESMMAFQQAVALREADIPINRRLVFRIGIHLAHAINDGGDVYGHGVNLAVRLQEVAEPGSIYVSDVIVDDLKKATSLGFDGFGQRVLKNLRQPVSIYRLQGRMTERPAKSGSTRGRYGEMATAAVIGLGILVYSPEAMHSGDRSSTGPDVVEPGGQVRQSVNDGHAHAIQNETADEVSVTRDVLAASPLQDRSGHYPLMSAILANRNTPRLHIQPNGTTVSRHRWTERFENASSDVIFHEDEAKGRAVSSSSFALDPSQRSIESRSQIADDAYAQAWALFGRNTPQDFRGVVSVLEEVLVLEPDHNPALGLLAAVYWGSWQNRWQLGSGLTAVATLKRAEHYLNRIGEPTAMAHAVTSEMLTAGGQHALAIAEAERAMLQEPSLAIGYYAKGLAVLFNGRPDKAEGLIEAARRLDPRASRYLFGLAFAQFNQGRFDEAFSTLNRATTGNRQDDWSYLLLAATSGFLGRSHDARHALYRFDRLSVPMRGWFATQVPHVHDWPFRRGLDRQRLRRGLVLAGIPNSVHLAGR